MRTRILFVAVLTAAGCFAQSEPAKAAPAAEPKFFHLDFVVKELEAGKVINSRAYAMTISTAKSERTSIRTGGRLPVPTGESMNAFTFHDVGTNIDCNNAAEVDNQLTLQVNADVSSVATDPDTHHPVTRQLRWSSPVIVPLRKPTTIFSSDDPSSRRQMQLELTATPIR